ILHISATVWLVVLMARALKVSGHLDGAGGWHLLASYAWILLPVLIAPLILLGYTAGPPIESTAPQALIYGWVLQFGIALVPYIARKYFLKQEKSQLGGSWLSIAAVSVGSVFIWTSIFLVPARGVLYGIGFVLYALSILQPIKELLQITQDGLQKHELA
ncbi:MAG TPA: hypothetical protein PLV64_20535, partial [Anaerolineales bacterium]|nr:hypothetical protein [Anaerolineales bacterium]